MVLRTRQEDIHLQSDVQLVELGIGSLELVIEAHKVCMTFYIPLLPIHFLLAPSQLTNYSCLLLGNCKEKELSLMVEIMIQIQLN